jgi:DNA-binding transcriptional ArsR family regulator
VKDPFHPSIKDVSLEAILYALSDPVRLSIVQQLATTGEMTCGQFCSSANKGKSTLTHHFKVLRDSGIIHTRVDGREHFTTLRLKDLNSRFPDLLDTILQAAKNARKATR